MRINFSKMEGTGNDYIYINCLNNPIMNPSELARYLSDRHYGIGGDGIVLILPSSRADFRMRIFNNDGSEAEMCGNASRCIGRYLFDKGLTEKKIISLQTKSGIRIITLKIDNGIIYSVMVEMGRAYWPSGRGVIDRLQIENVVYSGMKVSMGNPHFVIFTDRITDYQIQRHGRIIETHPLFPDGTNVEFVRIIDRQTVEFRVWERGSGETLSCGTGACAVAAAARESGFSGKTVKCITAGGPLILKTDDTDTISMEGSANFIFEGSIVLDDFYS